MKNKKIIKYIAVILTSITMLLGVYVTFKETGEIDTNKITEAITIVTDVIVSEETKIEAEDTIDVTEKGVEIATVETIESSLKEEKEVTDESALEIDAVVEQENIAYNGDITGDGLKLLGKCQGLTYYSQADSRWATKLYTSTNNKTQTMKSSACGPTSAAMIVSSSKGAILPTTMAKLFVDNGYRTANNGTAWSAYSFVADYFDFKEYYTTSNFDTAMNYLKQKKSDKSSKYYIIASCGSGLFTTGGHYIVLAGLDDNTIKVYDPYIYNGKFTTASRKKANVKVDGNTAYVTKANFKKYANYKNFWIFSNDKAVETKKKSTSYTRYVNVKVNSKLNVRKENKKSSKLVKQLSRATKVTVYETKGNWSRIGTNQWVSSEYLSKTKPTTIKNTVGKTKKLKSKCTLYSKSSLKGTKYTYKKNTTVKILKNISSSVDYVQVVKTGRKAYIKNKYYK